MNACTFPVLITIPVLFWGKGITSHPRLPGNTVHTVLGESVAKVDHQYCSRPSGLHFIKGSPVLSTSWPTRTRIKCNVQLCLCFSVAVRLVNHLTTTARQQVKRKSNLHFMKESYIFYWLDHGAVYINCIAPVSICKLLHVYFRISYCPLQLKMTSFSVHQEYNTIQIITDSSYRYSRILRVENIWIKRTTEQTNSKLWMSNQE